MIAASRPLRSVLYLPGSNLRAIEKARSLPADALIFDLEDAVAPEAKETAREQVCAAVKSRSFGRRAVIIRVNAPDTEWGEDDLRGAIAAASDAILIPKVSSPSDLDAARAALAGHGMSLWAMIETPRAILNVAAIASAGGDLDCLVMGTNDLVKELRADPGPGREGISAALSLTVAAARAFGLCVIDGVFNDIKDRDGFCASCLQSRTFGFDGKTLIHPSQIADCNEILAPSPKEIGSARKIIAAFSSPENSGKGAIAVDGRMVERLHLDTARDMVARAETIAAMQTG